MDIKPQDWHNTRYIDYAPKHFIIFLLNKTNRLNLLNWIEVNTSGRYSIGTDIGKIGGEVGSTFLSKGLYIAFEEPADATMYSLFYK